MNRQWHDVEQNTEVWQQLRTGTRAMAEAGSVIAIKALELDGLIPSCLEGQLLMAAKADGLVELREDRYHWLSSQRSADLAYSVVFVGGWLNYHAKGYERFARPVRRIYVTS
ncbi:hypothetical protein ACI77I_21905 [Pseudomonas sp. D47]|uniref:hypothetical protein n=1 Tax=Pseudomonas sp. D47 TaxID=3159447 RepID=UPI00387B78D0